VNRLFKEYLKEADENPANIILSVSELVRKDADSEDEVAKTSIPYFLMLLKNAGLPISYAGLKSYYNAHPELKNVIQTFNDSEIVFVGQGDEKDGESLGEPQGEVPPEEVVDKMAKRAMKAREQVELDEDEYAALDSFTNSVDLTPEEEAKIAAGPDAYEADEKLMAKLMNHFSDGMPYGTQKGRDGDPYEFIFQELDLMGLIKEEVELNEKKVDHQLKIAIDTVKNPLKGEFLGGPSAKEAEKTLRTKYKYTDKMIAKLKEDVYGGSPAPMNTIDKVQSIMDNGSAMKIDGVMVDTFTASVIMAIYNKVNEKNQDKMRSMPVEKLASSAYMLANRFKEDVELDEGYYEMPPMDRDRYTDLPGLEGPFQTRSGKVVYYDPKEGKYYDRDSDMYLSYEEFKDYDQSRPEDFKMTVKMPKAMQKEDKFDYWQSVDSLAKLAGIKERSLTKDEKKR